MVGDRRSGRERSRESKAERVGEKWRNQVISRCGVCETNNGSKGEEPDGCSQLSSIGFY